MLAMGHRAAERQQSVQAESPCRRCIMQNPNAPPGNEIMYLLQLAALRAALLIIIVIVFALL
jgi:hypothetical protein